MPVEDMRRVLEQQFLLLLTEKYSGLTFHEIEYAFRTEAPNFQDFGKVLNLNLVSNVLNAYVSKRQIVCEMENSKKKPPELPGINMTDAERAEWVEMTRQGLLSGVLRENMLPIPVFEYLIRTGQLAPTREEMWDAYKLAGTRLNPDGKAVVYHDPAVMLSKQILLAKYLRQ